MFPHIGFSFQRLIFDILTDAVVNTVCVGTGKDLAAVQRTLSALGSLAVTKDEGTYKGDPNWFFK